MDIEHESGECLLVALVTDLPPEIGMLLFGFLSHRHRKFPTAKIRRLAKKCDESPGNLFYRVSSLSLFTKTLSIS
jgi:hypothetical protein